MSEEVRGPDVIPAVTGGVFDVATVLTASDDLLTSPAFVLASYIIAQAIGNMTDPDDSALPDWPLFVSFMPDTSNVKTECGALYDTSPIKDGRLMAGQVISHFGIQLKIRSRTQVDGYAKAEAIAVALDTVQNETQVVGSYTYQLYNISRQGSPVSLGMEEGNKGRYLFTVNLVLTMKRVI